jgi:hypothetical protein
MGRRESDRKLSSVVLYPLHKSMSLERFSRADRVKMPRHHIDPGFINHRLIFSTLGHGFRESFEARRVKADDHMAKLWNDHLLVTYLLSACHTAAVATLGEALQSPAVGTLFCSTEQLAPSSGVYDEPRATSAILLPYESDWEVVLAYSTRHIYSDTMRGELHDGAKVTVVAGIREVSGNRIVAYPLVIGSPSFDHPLNKDLGLDLIWFGWEWFELFPEDIDEFAMMSDVEYPMPAEWQSVMAKIPESYVKQSVCDLLKDTPAADWGGELLDHFSSSVHLNGERTTAAFLLKGPAHFSEMTPKHLGKNADQIYRLTASTAQVLIVQHSHDIGDAVRATLRAFAVNPATPRRYCLLDGRDTYRLLKAYGKLPPTDSSSAAPQGGAVKRGG